MISTLLSCASLFNIVSFYFKFGEKISCLHFIGVAFMIACIVFISVAATKDKDEAELEEQQEDTDDTMGLGKLVAGILAVLCGLCGAVFMSTKHLFVRMFKSNYSGVD